VVPRGTIEVVPAALGDDSVLYGALALASQMRRIRKRTPPNLAIL